MRPWGITTKPCIGSKERTKNDLIRAFYCALDSILSARTRALKSLCAVLACPGDLTTHSLRVSLAKGALFAETADAYLIPGWEAVTGQCSNQLNYVLTCFLYG
jgi:hypothetical protein